MLDQATDWLAGFVADTLNKVWSLLTATLFHLPDVTVLPQVQDLTARSLMVVNVGYVLFIMAAGIVAMTHGSVQARHTAGELLPRLCTGLVLANFGTFICQRTIEAGNALVLALTGQGIASDATLQMLLRNLKNEITTAGSGLLLSAIIGLLIDVLILILLVGWIMRFAILIIVTGVAPIALACHGLPWTTPVATLWWKTLGGVVATVVLQAIALHTSLSIWLTPVANLPAIGWPFDPDGLLNLLVVAVLLWVTVRIPAMVAQHVTGSGGRSNVLGMIVRLVIVQQLTRGLGGLARDAGRGGARAGAAGRPGGPGRPGASGAGWPRRPAPAGPTRPTGPTGRSGQQSGRRPGGAPRASSPAQAGGGRAQGTTTPAPAGAAAARSGAPGLTRPSGPGGRPGTARPVATAAPGSVSPVDWPGRSGRSGRVPVGSSGPGTGWPGSSRTTRSPYPAPPASAARRTGTTNGGTATRTAGTGWPSAGGAPPVPALRPPSRDSRRGANPDGAR